MGKRRGEEKALVERVAREKGEGALKNPVKAARNEMKEVNR